MRKGKVSPSVTLRKRSEEYRASKSKTGKLEP